MPKALEIRPCADAKFVGQLLAKLSGEVGVLSDEDRTEISTAVLSPRAMAIEAIRDGERVGAWLFHPFSECRGFHVHTLLLPSARGATAIALGKLGMEWVWSNTDWSELWSTCQPARRDVLFFAMKVGFMRVGVSETTGTILLKIDRPKEDR